MLEGNLLITTSNADPLRSLAHTIMQGPLIKLEP